MNKKLLSIIAVSVSALSVQATLATNTIGPVIVYADVVSGPDTSNPAYDGWAMTVVSNLYHGNPAGSLGSRLQAPYVAQTTDLSGFSAWFTVHVVARDPSYLFTPAQLVFKEWSTDTGNSLGKTNTFNDPSYVYTPGAIGVKWGPGGRGHADSVVDSGFWNQTSVNEFVFVGAMSTHYVYGTNGFSLADIQSYIGSVARFNVTGEWTFTDTNGSWRARKTLYKVDVPQLAIVKPTVLVNGVSLALGITAGTNDTWVMQYSPQVSPSIWNDYASVNGNDNVLWPAATNGFWRLRLE